MKVGRKVKKLNENGKFFGT